MPRAILEHFACEHLPPRLRAASQGFGELARRMDELLPAGPEKSTALRKLLEAKDCAVRAALDAADGA